MYSKQGQKLVPPPPTGSSNWLSLVKDSSVVNLGVEIEYMHPLGSPLRDDGVQFILEESKLAAVDRA
jgi:hypothetical protein